MISTEMAISALKKTGHIKCLESGRYHFAERNLSRGEAAQLIRTAKSITVGGPVGRRAGLSLIVRNDRCVFHIEVDPAKIQSS